jgi:hypothetical protein
MVLTTVQAIVLARLDAGILISNGWLAATDFVEIEIVNAFRDAGAGGVLNHCGRKQFYIDASVLSQAANE